MVRSCLFKQSNEYMSTVKQESPKRLDIIALHLLSFVLFPGGHAPPDVSLGLVDLQHHLHLLIQGPVEGGQPLGQVLVHRGFAQAEFLGGTAHRALLFDDVQCHLAGSLFHVPFQTATLPHGSHTSIYM